MKPDAGLINQIAVERGFEAATVEKVLRLLGLLSEIARHPFLRMRLVLKGGTALNLFHWEMPRLSVDIDLNYVGAVSLDQTRAERPRVQQALQNIVDAGSYRIQCGNPTHANETWHLWYRSAQGMQDHVEVDVNFLMRVCLFEPEIRPCMLDRAAPVGFSVLAIEELMAGKLVALLDRSAPRDLYDTYCFLMSGIDYDHGKLRQAFLIFACAGLPLPLWEYDADRLVRIDEAAVAQTLWPVLVLHKLNYAIIPDTTSAT